MLARNRSSADEYKKIGLNTEVSEASPHKLILMLYEGAALSITMAIASMQAGDVKAKGECISNALDIISRGLQANLNLEAGADLAAKLNNLYDYMCNRLIHANLHNDKHALEEVLRLLNEIREAWGEIANDPAVVSFCKERG